MPGTSTFRNLGPGGPGVLRRPLQASVWGGSLVGGTSGSVLEVLGCLGGFGASGGVWRVSARLWAKINPGKTSQLRPPPDLRY